MNKVYFSKNFGKEFLIKLKEELKLKFGNCKKLAVKIHLGVPGNQNSLTPEKIKPIIDILKELKINYFFFDSSTIGTGPRCNPEKHKKTAYSRGWNKYGEVNVDDSAFKTIKGSKIPFNLCKTPINADGVFVITHFKGHPCTGFGGNIKNVGIGMMKRETKQEMHKHEKIFPSLVAQAASIAQKHFKKQYYISIAKEISKVCDCEPDPKGIISKDIGIFFGEDGVALDKAAYDLTIKGAGEDVFLKHNKIDGLIQVKEAEKFGMGSSEYDLIEL